MTIFINLIGGPGTGKSTTAMAIMMAMKIKRYQIEYIPEVVKSIVWREEFHLLEDQKRIATEIYDLMKQIDGKVDYIVMDGPLAMQYYYNRYHGKKEDIQSIEKMLDTRVQEFNCINIWLTRSDLIPYEEHGRFQSHQEAKEVDQNMTKLLMEKNIPLERINVKTMTLDLNTSHIPQIIDIIETRSKTFQKT